MPNNKELFEQKMNALADSINTKAGTTGAKTIQDLKITVDNIVIGVVPTGNQDIETLNEYDVTNKATARISATERAKCIPENIADGVTLLGVTGTHQGGGTQPTLFAPIITKGVNEVSWANDTRNGGFNPTITASVDGNVVTSPLSVTQALDGKTLTATASATNFQDGVATETLEYVYTITSNITNGSLSGATTIRINSTASVSVEPNGGYGLPATISVTGASFVYDNITGNVTLSNPTGNVTIAGNCDELVTTYLTFEGTESFALSVNIKGWNGIIEYSTDHTTWQTWTGSPISGVINNNKYYLYLRGTGNTHITGDPNAQQKRFIIATNGSMSCYGDIDNLLDYQLVANNSRPTIDAAGLAQMFSGWASLIVAPQMPSGTIGNYGLYSMFNSCTSLVAAPKMPSKNLGSYCYSNMFYGCTSLESLPELSATTLSERCYENMFFNCTKIKISETQTGDYQNAYRIPFSGTGTDGGSSTSNMLYGTGGTFKGTPALNTTYYTSNDIVTLPPQKGDIINIDMTGSGTPQEYRILKNVSGDVFEVLAMTNSTSSQQFASSGQTYENSDLDTYLNTTWYNTLSSTAKTAIVDKTFRQDSWYGDTTGNPDYQGVKIDGNYQLSLGNASFGNEITRHCYALNIQDIIDYLEVTPEMTSANTTLTLTNIWQMYWNRNTALNDYIWVASANASSSGHIFRVLGSSGYISSYLAANTNAVRPSFQIDLSKITWSK